MDLGIKGKKAIVCASSKGLGKACAKALMEEGVSVVINARGEDTLKETFKELSKIDKDRIRKDLGNIIQAYQEVARRLGIIHEESNISEVKFGKPKAVNLKKK